MGLIENIDKFENEIKNMKEAYDRLVSIYGKYMDMKKSSCSIAAIWVIASKMHEHFRTFPYLYLNAMKGSGKTRFMGLTAFLIDGFVTTSVTPAVLFRENIPVFIDEAETIGSKENPDRRELLNSGYKKGTLIKRVSAEKERNVEAFDPYRPIGMANIDGLDDVLEDRCIKIILDKSFNKEITRRPEIFEFDEDIMKVKDFLSIKESNVVGVVNAIYGRVKVVYLELCKYLMNSNIHQTTSTTYTTLTTQTTLILDRLSKSEILGRDLELWLPLIVTASTISEEVLDEVMSLAEASSKARMENTMMENPDIVMLSFLYEFYKDKTQTGFVQVADIVKEYKEDRSDKEDEWFNARALGRMLVRQNLLKRKKRVGKGILVIIDYEKVKDKVRRFGLAEDLGAFVKPEKKDDAFTKQEE